MAKKVTVKVEAPPKQSSIKQALLGLYGITGVALSTFGGFKVPFAESNAKEYWRHALAGIILVLALIAGIISLALYLFNANYFKSQIIDYVKVNNQRDLTLDGDLTVSFFPKLGLDAGKMTISQRNSNRNFASIESGHFQIAWWPLFLKQLQIEGVTLDGMHANLVRFKNGSTNLDDLFTGQSGTADIKFEIDSIKLNNASVSLQDEISGHFVSLHELSLETGKLADSVPANISSRFRLESIKPRIDSKVKLNTHLLFNLKEETYELANLEGEMEGEFAGLSNIHINYQGTMRGNAKADQVSLDKLAIHARGQFDQRKLDTKLDIPKLSQTKGKWSGTSLSMNTQLLKEDENLTSTLDIPAFEISENSFRTAAAALTFDLFATGRSMQGKLSSSVSYDIPGSSLKLTDISSNFNLSHPALNGKLPVELNGNLQADMTAQTLKFGYKAKADESRFTGDISVTGFSQPQYTFDTVVDKLDLDRHLAANWSRKLQDNSTPVDFSALRDLSVKGKLRANELKFANLKTDHVSAEINLNQSVLQIDAINAWLYGGTLNGNLSLDGKSTPAISFRHKLISIQLNQLFTDFRASEARLNGKGNVSIEASGTGDTLGAIRKSLAGTASVQLARGSISGLALSETLLANKTRLGEKGAVFSTPAKPGESTAFTEYKAGYDISAGQMKSTDWQIRSPIFSLQGTAEHMLESGQINYLGTVSLPGNLKRSAHGEIAELKGLNLPLKINGSADAPVFNLELGEASGLKPPTTVKNSPPSGKPGS